MRFIPVASVLVLAFALCVFGSPCSHASGNPVALPSTVDNARFVKQSFKFKTIENATLDKIGSIVDIAQDANGFMWFAGANGLVRYDANRFKLYESRAEDQNSLSNSNITSLLIDSRHRLWVATRSGLNLYLPSLDGFKRFLHDPSQVIETSPLDSEAVNRGAGISSNKIESIFEDSKGRIWISTGDYRIDRFDFEAGLFEYFRLHQPGDYSVHEPYIFSMYEDTQNNLWFGGYHGLTQFDVKAGRLFTYRHNANDASSLSFNTVRRIFQSAAGALWVGTEKGLNQFKPELGTFRRYQAAADLPGRIGGDYILSVVEDKDGQVWVASDGGGLNLYSAENDSFQSIKEDSRKPHQILNNNIRSIFVDNNNGVWVGHHPAGLSYLDRGAAAFQNYRRGEHEFGLSNSDILSIAEDSKGNLWVGTENGLNVVSRTSGRVKRYLREVNDSAGLPASPVISIGVLDDGVLLIGTWGGGLSKLDIELDTFEKLALSLPGESPSAITIDSKQQLWVGFHEGLMLFQDVKNLSDGKLIMSSSALSIAEDEDGFIWVGEYSRLAKLDAKGIVLASYSFDSTKANSLPDGPIRSIEPDKGGVLWLASEGGAVHFNSQAETFSLLSSSQGARQAKVSCILKAGEGAVWFGTAHGLTHFEVSSKMRRQYYSNHGLAGDYYKSPACLYLSTGELAFGSTKGLSVFKADEIIHDSSIPPVYITQVTIVGEDDSQTSLVPPAVPSQVNLQSQQSMDLPYNVKALSFELAVLDYKSPELNKYVFYLDGVDHSWREPSEGSQVNYYDLSPGAYTFKVRGANRDGVWNNNGTIFQFIVLPPWWATWWAYVFYLLSFTVFCAVTFVKFKKMRATDSPSMGDKANRATQQNFKEYLPKIIQGMDEQQLFLQHNLTIKGFAQAIGISAKDVSNTINQELKCNFLEFVTGYRLKLAKQLLVDSQHKSVTDIMIESGFNSKSAFYRMFKNETGMTPTAYRTANVQCSDE